MTATVRVMSPEEIQARAGATAPFLRLPRRDSVFAERAMRLRQLAPGHAMGDFLAFAADLAQQQQRLLADFPGAVPLPDEAAFDAAARRGRAPLESRDWPRDPAWLTGLRRIVQGLEPAAPDGVRPVLRALAEADDAALERQADALLAGRTQDLDLAAAPLVAAALQAYFSHLVIAATDAHPRREAAWGRPDADTLCPCCGSRPTASVIPATPEAPGQRYLHCSLCSAQWHFARIRCSHCGRDERVAYESLDLADRPADATDTEDSSVVGTNGASPLGGRAPVSRREGPTVQAEVCEACNHYLKIVHADRDPFADPVADDLASLTLDLLVSEAGRVRHGLNLLLLFGEPEPPPDPERS